MTRLQGWMRWMSCCWPGLPELWNGRFNGLLVALIFTVILQTTLATCVIWPDLLSWGGQVVVCFGVLLYWMSFALPQWVRWAKTSEEIRSPETCEHLFRAAQCEYLKGNWFQAEELWGQVLRARPGDVETRLYLATLFRRLGRLQEASEMIRQLEQDPQVLPWRLELQLEQQRLKSLTESAASRSGDARKPPVGEGATPHAA